MITIIASIIFLAVLIYIFFFKKSDARRHYEELIKRDSLTVEEQLWIYCYKYNYTIVNTDGYYLIKNWWGDIYDPRDHEFWNDLYSTSKIHTLEKCLEALDKRLEKKDTVIIDGTKIPQSKDVFLDDLIKHELDPQEREL